jgi:hypothetical protein
LRRDRRRKSFGEWLDFKRKDGVNGTLLKTYAGLADMTLPSDQMGSAEGPSRTRQSSAVAKNRSFSLDEASDFRETHRRQADKFPGSGRTETRPSRRVFVFLRHDFS